MNQGSYPSIQGLVEVARAQYDCGLGAVCDRKRIWRIIGAKERAAERLRFSVSADRVFR
jgi:hypothetical protein